MIQFVDYDCNVITKEGIREKEDMHFSVSVYPYRIVILIHIHVFIHSFAGRRFLVPHY